MSRRDPPGAWPSRLEPSIGGMGDSYDHTGVEIIDGLYKCEIIHGRGRWQKPL